MPVTSFMVTITDENLTFKESILYNTPDMRERNPTQNYPVSGSGITVEALGNDIIARHSNYSAPLYMTSVLRDGNDRGWTGTAPKTNPYGGSPLGNILSFLNDVKCEAGETRIIWFGAPDSTYSKEIPRIEIVASSGGNWVSYTVNYKIDNTTYYNVILNAEFGSIYLPWINEDGSAIVGVGYLVAYVTTSPTANNQIGLEGSFSVTADATKKHWFEVVMERAFDTDNPYAGGGISKEDKGDSNFSEDSDDVTVDNLPSIDAVGTGFATLFTPSKPQLTALADVMWNNGVFQALQNLVENITNMFTSLAIVPFTVDAGSTVEVTWLGLPLTSIYLTLASKQFYEFDMGSIDLNNDARIFTSGSALDYSPFSRLGIFLPFIGFEELDIDECRNAPIGLKYRIDILSGTCVALISVAGNTIYQFTGNCLSQIPITNESIQSLITDAVNVGIAATQASAARGAVGAAESAMDESTTKSDINSAANKVEHAQTKLMQSKSTLASATANMAMGMKPTFGKNGSVSAAASLLSVRQPYLFLTTPRQSMPNHYQRYNGFPCNITGKLNEFSGYTEVESIRLNGLVATSPEVEEIYDLLHAGVII